MKYSKKITAGLDIKINKSAIFYHTIQGFINMKQGEAEPNNSFKLFFGNVYETMELAHGENIIGSKNLTNN